MWWRCFIRCLICTNIYVALIVFSHSHYGLCKQFCRVVYIIPYAWCCGQRDVYTSCWGCIHKHQHTNCDYVLHLHHSDVWWWILGVKQCIATRLYPKITRHFIKLLCYYIRTRRIIWTFWVQICRDYHLNSIYIYYCCFWLFVFCYVILYAICVCCKIMCICMK